MTRRLWFLWPEVGPDVPSRDLPRRCGCLGGCAFFGNNLSGRKLLADWEQHRLAMHQPSSQRANRCDLDYDDEDEDEDDDDEEEESERAKDGGWEKRALLCVLPADVNDMGFGQSLLGEQCLVFELHEKECCVESRNGMRLMRPEAPAGEAGHSGVTSTR